MSTAATPHEGPTTGEPAPTFQQKLGLFDATMLVAGTMIGSGIFLVSADIARDVGSSGWLMAVWVLTGLMTMMGALSYAELAAMMPHAGGQYIFLRDAYSPLWGFLYGWTCFLVIQTGSIAAVAVAFAKFLSVLVPGLGVDPAADAWVLFEIKDLDLQVPLPLPWLNEPLIIFERKDFVVCAGHVVAVGIVGLLSLWNCLGVQEGKWVQNVFTVAKTLALIVLIVAGFTVAASSEALKFNTADLWSGIADSQRFRDTQELLGLGAGAGLLIAWMVAGGAMVGSLFSADAWNNVTFTAGEVRDPRRTLPHSLALGTGMVMALYLLANLGYLTALPVRGDPQLDSEVRAAQQRIVMLEKTDQSEAAKREQDRLDKLKADATTLERGIAYAKDDRVGAAVMELASGPAGLFFIAIAVMISTFGCVNGMVLMGARLYYAMARDRLFFQSVGRLNRRGVPAAGLILQGIWSILLVFSGTYSELLDYVIFAALFFYVLTVTGLFVLRYRLPNAERPYKAFGYPIIPALYVLLCAAIMVDLLIVRPVYTWPGLIIVLTGIPVYYLWRILVPRAKMSA
jgi:APA family basic amino acid/polyamine antiporter